MGLGLDDVTGSWVGKVRQQISTSHLPAIQALRQIRQTRSSSKIWSRCSRASTQSNFALGSESPGTEAELTSGPVDPDLRLTSNNERINDAHASVHEIGTVPRGDRQTVDGRRR